MLGKNHLIQIKEYYQKAKEYLDREEYQLAFNTLYKEMPQDLYDISLDLLFNRNMDLGKDKEDIIQLIKEVDYKLNPQEDDNN